MISSNLNGHLNLNPIKNFIRNITGRAKMQHNFVGAPSFAGHNPYSLFNSLHSDGFASAYPNIRAISQEYMTVTPYAIDANGKPVDSTVTNALYHPNQTDSSVAFFEKIAVSTLALRKTYILVWRREGLEAKPGGEITADNIGGFTFLEFPGVTRRDGRTFYNIGSQEFSDKEVITLPGGVDPKNLYAGYAPSEASRSWIKLDDYIADYQAGFFENGAVPAGQFLITAPTIKEYNDTVDMLEARHRGASKNGNVTYSHRPIDPNSGKPAEAQIQWTPFAQSNKDIDFKNLFEQTNKRIDMAYGVSQFIKGVDDAPNYATAQVSDKNFAKRAVYPLLLRNYTQITHELNRITNGLGIAITFKYDIPIVADEEKVEAETKAIHATTITTLVDKGFSLDSIVDAFELSNSYKLLKQDNSKPVIDNDKPDVDEGGEVEAAPDPEKIDGVTPLNKKKPKAKKSRQSSPQNSQSTQDKMESAALELMEKQVSKAIEAVDKAQDAADKEDLDAFVDDAYDILKDLVIAGGVSQYDKGLALIIAAGLSDDNTSSFTLSDDQIDHYRMYLRSVGTSYSEQTTNSIRAILERAHLEGWSGAETKKELNTLPEIEGWRATRLARSEVGRAEGNGSLYSMEQITTETGYEINKVWQVNSNNPCAYCIAMDGTRVQVEQPFIPLGGSIEASDGSILVNDFVDVDTADAHPNCGCSLYYEVAG